MLHEQERFARDLTEIEKISKKFYTLEVVLSIVSAITISIGLIIAVLVAFGVGFVLMVTGVMIEFICKNIMRTLLEKAFMRALQKRSEDPPRKNV